jgi:RHS repeat-associated protein
LPGKNKPNGKLSKNKKMKTQYISKISCIVFLNSFLFTTTAQNAESWTLSQREDGNKNYVAREYIHLVPGFRYRAMPGNSTGNSSSLRAIGYKTTFNAKIDQTLLFPPTENTYAKEDGTITTSSTEGAVVGNLSGAFDVSPSGAAIYSVPIECPPGIQGMQPNISLVYNSQSGSGIAGMCWNIGGLSMISRVTKNYYYDDEKSGIIWDKTSPLAWDGQRLIKIQEWGTDSIEYRTESGLDKIIGYEMTKFGPSYFKVYTKDGSILKYGGDEQYLYYDEDLYYISFSNLPARIKSYRSLDSERYDLGWALSKSTDSNNNYIQYTYSATLWKKTAADNNYYNYYFGDNRISKIEYGNQNTKVASVHFQYKDKTSFFIQYIDSVETKNQLILDKIEVKGINDELLETYQLTYNSQDENNFLTEIKRINSSDEFIHPLKFEWYPIDYSYEYDDDIEFTDSLELNGDDANFTPVSYGDFNGDGLIDVVMRANLDNWTKNLWIVYQNMGNGSFQYKYEEILECPKKSEVKENTFLFLDLLDDDNKDELYVGRVIKNTNPTSYTYRLDCYRYIDGVFKRYSSGDMTHSTDSHIYDERGDLHAVPADFMGKGTPQFIIFSKNNTPRFYLTTLSLPGFPNTWGNGKSKILLSDINGNGKTEIAYIKRNADNTYDATTVFYEYRATGSGSFRTLLTTPLFHYNDNIFTGDFNGDGNTDFLVRTPYLYESGGSWKMLTSSGTGFIETSMNSFIESDVAPSDLAIADVNQDGKSDIVFADPNIIDGGASSYTLRVLVNTGDITFIEKTLNTSFPLPIGTLTVSSKFKTPHGPDFFWTANWTVGGPQILSLCKNKWFNKISEIKNSFGEQTTISYKDNRNPYQISQKIRPADNGEIESVVNNFLPQLEIVNTVKATNTSLSYTFENAFLHKEGRGFLGFGKITIKDAVKTITQVSENQHNTSFQILYPYKTATKLTNGTLISETINKYSVINNDNKKYFLRLDSVSATDALKNITVKTAYSDYDSDRNPQTIKTDYGNGITSTQSLSYIKKGSQFINKIASNQVTLKTTGQPDVVRKEYFFYDDKGNITLQTKDSTDVNKVQTFYSNYDTYGNPQKITTVANGIARSNTLTYSSSGRFVKTKKDDQLNETITYNYNESKGLLTSKIDRLGTTDYQYDSWGRLTLTTYPIGIKTANALQWAGNISKKPSDAKYYSYTETSGKSSVIIWYDALGREIRNESYGLNWTQKLLWETSKNRIWVDTEYDAKGRIYRVSEPYYTIGTQTWAATHTYDNYGRIKQTITPMGTTAYDYSGLTTTVTSPTDTKSTTTDSAGRVISQTTNGKKVDFIHYASGLVKTATPEGGQAIRMEYDLQGNRTKLIDPDAGTITSEYDGWGQLLSEQQAVHVPTRQTYGPIDGSATLLRSEGISGLGVTGLGITAEVWGTITTTYNYLPSGLLNYKLCNGEKTGYVYDSQHRLKGVSIAGKHSQSFDYDQWDRIIQTRDTVENNKVFVRKTEYDALGRVYKEIHPDGYYVTNFYDKYGYLTQVKDPNGTLIWKSKEGNARGQQTRTQSGSNETIFKFDSKGLPLSIVTPGIMEWSYIFNNKGNLVSRKEGITGYKDSLYYDSMNRLTNWNIYQGSSLKQNNSLSFNSTTGNITSKSDLGNYILNYEGSRPHALTSITGMPSAIPSVDQTITYTDFKKVKTITEGDNNLTVAYGTDEQRVKTVLNKNGTSLTRYYMGNYEEEIVGSNIRKIHYLCGGNGLAAVYIQNAGKDTLYYAHTDYQGSLTALSLPNGTVAERYAYDPWGKRRNPNNWSQNDTRTAFILNRGYTMHEHLPEFNLINMNGRMYDPLTAMFFSPDPYLQSPGNWLNYNRYGYCLNNPFLYTDPSGEFLWIIPNISWSKNDGISIGISVIVGIPGVASVQAGVGYNIKGNDAYAYAGATAAFNTVYASVSTGSGFSVGWSAGISPQMGFPISTNFTSVGVNYNVSHNNLSGNLSAWYVDKNRWTFNPSVSAMFLEEQATNLVRGQGFRNNDQVLSHFVENGQQQKALDYFGFEGKYDPKAGNSHFDPNDGSIHINDNAFSKNYDYLRGIYGEELFHSKDYLYAQQNTPKDLVPHEYEEWRAQNYLYKNQGLYSKSGIDWIWRINHWGVQAGVYDTDTSLFSSRWWHFIYKIPRRW